MILWCCRTGRRARSTGRLLGLCALLLGNVAGLSWAQTQDSLAHYELGEIVVGPDSVQSQRRNAATIQRVGLAAIAQSDAASIDRVLRHVPGAHLQTNSRGETLVYLRGAGERQVAVFFDGALLNVPWDNRIDLSLVPAEMVGEITVVKGPPPVVYGTNVIGGALNLTSRQLDRPGRYAHAAAVGGSYGAAQVRAYYLRRSERLGFALFSGYSKRDGIGMPAGTALPFGQEDETRRTNTHRRIFSNYGQVSFHSAAGARIGLSALILSGEKGIAPEGHHDPETARVRYWRYPAWHASSFIVSGLLPLGRRGATLRGALWTSLFDQTINQYKSIEYATLGETQEDDDFTQGTRLSLYVPIGPGAITAALSALSSRHKQLDKAFEESSDVQLERAFRQQVFSAGAEYAWSGRVAITLGASLDGVATPETGDKPSQPPNLAYSIVSGVSTEARPGVRARVAVGRKVRFPTMRELFGEALGRFLVNPDLGPEHALLAEAGVEVEREAITAEVVGFFNRTYDTIDQRLVHRAGEDKPRRQRVNLQGSSAIGLESTVATRLAAGISLRCNIMTLHARARTLNGRSTRLTEKPSVLGQCASSYTSPVGFSLLLEYVLTGTAYGMLDSGVLAPLPRSNVVNARVGYLFVLDRWAAEAFARVNNATDTVTLPQLGLPGPGREFHAGMQVSF